MLRPERTGRRTLPPQTTQRSRQSRVGRACRQPSNSPSARDLRVRTQRPPKGCAPGRPILRRHLIRTRMSVGRLVLDGPRSPRACHTKSSVSILCLISNQGTGRTNMRRTSGTQISLHTTTTGRRTCLMRITTPGSTIGKKPTPWVVLVRICFRSARSTGPSWRFGRRGARRLLGRSRDRSGTEHPRGVTRRGAFGVMRPRILGMRILRIPTTG